MPDIDQRLEAALARRSELEAQKQRLEGRLEAALKTLSDVETECRKKGIDPDKIDETIDKLTVRYTELVMSLEQDISKAAASLTPFLQEN